MSFEQHTISGTRTLTLLLFSFLIPGCGGDAPADSPKLLVAVEPQAPERMFRPLTARWEDISLDTVLVNPAQIQVEPDSWFVLDFGAASVLQFSLSGDLVGTWGVGGRGPGELNAPTDFFLTEDGEIWVLDPGNGRIQVFDRHSDSTRAIPLKVAGFRMISTGDGALIQTMSGGHMFAQIDSAGALVRQAGVLVEGQDRPGVGLSIEGRIAGGPQGEIYYVATRAGLLGVFDSSGAVRLLRSTITRRPFPAITQAADGTIRTERPADGLTIMHYALAVSSSSIFVLERVPSADEVEFVVDRYDRATGWYQESFAVPYEVISIKYVDGRLLLLTDIGLAQLVID